MKKKILFIIVTLIIFRTNANALTYGGCDLSTISRMKSLVTNVNVYYTHRMVNNTPYFDVTLTNLFPGAYFIDSSTGTRYNYNNSSNGELVIKGYDGGSGSYKFYADLGNCSNVSLGTKYYKFPVYNTYYNSAQCKDIPNFSLCKKWAEVNYSSDEFNELVNEYKESLKEKEEKAEEKVEYDSEVFSQIIDFYIKYYYYFLPAIIAICLLVMVIYTKKTRFKL